MGRRDEMRELLRRLEELGCTIRQGCSSHYKVYIGARYIYTLPSTGGDWRGIHRSRKDLRRLYGLEV